MAWSNSKVFRIFLGDTLKNDAAFDLEADTIKVALYDNDITPDNDVTSANSQYNAGAWVSSGNEVFHTGQWASGGVTLSGKVVDVSVADAVSFDAANATSGSSATLSSVHGVLVYDTTVSSRGISYNYLGGSNSVTSGVLTIIWHTNGIFKINL